MVRNSQPFHKRKVYKKNVEKKNFEKIVNVGGFMICRAKHYRPTKQIPSLDEIKSVSPLHEIIMDHKSSSQEIMQI